MIAEIVATGDEIRCGALVDRNSAHIASRLEEEGLEVARHHCVGDDMESLVSMFGEIASRADIVIVTGGLGPTEDDLTAAAVAQTARVDLVLDKKTLATIEAFFKRMDWPMGQSNSKQAQFPRDSEILANPIGTAPGFKIRIGRCTFFCLPGVPREMQKMLADEVIPHLRALLDTSRQFSLVRTVGTFGITESMIGESVSGIAADFPEIKVGLRAKLPEIQVRLYARGDDKAMLIQNLATVTQRIKEKLGDKVFADDGQTMEATVGALLVRKQATVAVAESCTGGLIAHWLTNVPGSSRFFLFSGVTYANEAKIEILGVSPETITDHGAVSIQTACQMAEGARKVANATYGIATSGIAGPDGGTDEKPVGTVCIGLAGSDGVVGRRFYFPTGNRDNKKKLFAMTALDILRRTILGLSNLAHP